LFHEFVLTSIKYLYLFDNFQGSKQKISLGEIYGQGNVPGNAEHKVCPSSLGCLLASGSLVSIGLMFPIPARPGLSGVKSTGGGLLACSPNVFPSVVAAPEVSLPHPDGLSVLGLAAKTCPIPTLNDASTMKTARF
jgi:hypothetical protein